MNQLLIDTLVALGFVLFSGWCLMGPQLWLRPKCGCAHVLPAQSIGMGLGGGSFFQASHSRPLYGRGKDMLLAASAPPQAHWAGGDSLATL